ncbi:DUF6482 family protein [Pseudomonas helleri]|uniref:Metal ABC transporter ATPase n=1 Tax=Pseudomonas helleri TaxID=1608996 RepID=A0A6A7Z037_9PSED|nr:DUF6482 family protein [Pseudomonas helleri]MQT25755.1 metal ABC transporter ATPase [Pseudomonas helleri]MQT81117.1 metal ABC transporter ATPase [Pseudomonas helleri]MQU17006.1 metal ABC transporter ATPase [Pseudomonas helleri]MQU26942.1 metal ABC transporter ATPase [Pseudomonas helleri]
MNLQTLTEHAVNSEIRELELLSLEGGFYLVRIRLDDGLFTLFDDRAKPMHLRSITQLRDLLQTVRAFPCVLVQQCAHDEMCGRDTGSVEEMRIPFSLT